MVQCFFNLLEKIYQQISYPHPDSTRDLWCNKNVKYRAQASYRYSWSRYLNNKKFTCILRNWFEKLV
jgi:hypothetical protein